MDDKTFSIVETSYGFFVGYGPKKHPAEFTRMYNIKSYKSREAAEKALCRLQRRSMKLERDK